MQSQLASVDPDALIALGTTNWPRWTFRVDDKCTIEFRPIPRKPEVRDKPADRPVGMIMSPAFRADNVAPIREKVLEKADHYGKLNQPFIVAANLMSPTVEHDDIVKALTGRDGSWERERVKQVSAILFTTWLMPISAPRAAARLFHNPAAERPYTGPLPALPQGLAEAGKIKLTDGRSLGDVFGLSAHWPDLDDDD